MGMIAGRQLRMTSGGRVNEFYKKGCQEKTSAATGRPRGFCLEIQPTVGFVLCSGFAFPLRFHFLGGDPVHRVLKLGKRNWWLSVNHGSIGGSWPIAISGYPRGHSV